MNAWQFSTVTLKENLDSFAVLHAESLKLNFGI